MFHLSGGMTGWQILGWVMVFAGLIIMNEIARRSKAGGAVCFFVIPAALTVYFISIYVGAAQGAEWALNNQTYVHMNSWFHYAKLYAALAGCIGFMIIKYHWGGLGKSHAFKVFPFVPFLFPASHSAKYWSRVRLRLSVYIPASIFFLISCSFCEISFAFFP